MLLIDEGWTQTLELARALEREGFAVTVATANGTSVRTSHRTVTWVSCPHVGSSELVGWIDEKMTAEEERAPSVNAGSSPAIPAHFWAFDLVIPLSERLMVRLWDACVPWSDRVWPSTDAWQRRVLRDKIALVDELAARGVPTLRQRRIDVDDTPGIDRAVRDLLFPLVVKGDVGVGGERVRIVDHARELDAAMRWARELGGAWCLQEWASGPTYLVGGVFDEGRALRLYAGEKLEQWPARVGPAIRMRSTNDTRVREVGATAIQELWWTGIASADVIRRADGSVALLEINPRPWGSIACAESAGVDLWSAFAALVRGDEVDADLACRDGDERAVFPRYLMAPWYQSVRGAKMALRDLMRESDWRDPRFLVHTLRRLARLSRGARV
ncbi:MAG: ATP-grasp domain-containing protein [Kofleriaceae bacterium]